MNQNELNLREAWLRTEFFGQRLALIAGRLDLTNYFDHNAAANDETTQFISDALVNNPTLGLSSNGTGVAAVFDPKNGFNFKFGHPAEQPRRDQPVGFDLLAGRGRATWRRPPGLGRRQLPGVVPLGQYARETARNGVGVSIDQKHHPDRDRCSAAYGSAEVRWRARSLLQRRRPDSERGRCSIRSTPGASATRRSISPTGDQEKLMEGYYNFRLTERLRLSFHLQRVLDTGRRHVEVRLLPARRASAGELLAMIGRSGDTSW